MTRGIRRRIKTALGCRTAASGTAASRTAATRSAAVRVAGLVASVTAGACLVGCGNGVEVRGPSAPSSPSFISPTPAAASPSQSGKASSKSTPTPDHTKTDKSNGPGKSDGSDHNGGGNDGSGNGSNNGSNDGSNNGSNDGSNNGSNDSGNGSGDGSGATSTPPTGGGQNGPGNASVTECGLGDLNIGVRTPAGGAAAGSQYVLISFRNSSQKPCTIYGYPGVSFVGFQNGTQLGKPAARNHASNPQSVRLAPGSTKSALVQIAEAGNFPPQKCQPTTSDGFRVYPPDSYTAAYVPFKTSACQSKKVGQLTVYPVGVNS